MDGLGAEADTFSDIAVQLLQELFSRRTCRRRTTDLDLIASITNRNPQPIFNQF